MHMVEGGNPDTCTLKGGHIDMHMLNGGHTRTLNGGHLDMHMLEGGDLDWGSHGHGSKVHAHICTFVQAWAYVAHMFHRTQSCLYNMCMLNGCHLDGRTWDPRSCIQGASPHISQDPVMRVYDMCTLKQGEFDSRTCVQAVQVCAHVCTFMETWEYDAHIWTYEAHVFNSTQWDLYTI